VVARPSHTLNSVLLYWPSPTESELQWSRDLHITLNSVFVVLAITLTRDPARLLPSWCACAVPVLPRAMGDPSGTGSHPERPRRGRCPRRHQCSGPTAVGCCSSEEHPDRLPGIEDASSSAPLRARVVLLLVRGYPPLQLSPVTQPE
jgi:hypothetical protein